MTKFSGDYIQYSEKKGKRESKNLAFSLAVQIICYVLLIFFAIFFIWYTAFITTHKYYLVYGASMKNTLNSSLEVGDSSGTEDAVYVDCISKVKVFDVVVADRESKSVIKRVMATEGDYISVAVYKDANGVSNLYFYRIEAGSDLSNFDIEDARLDENQKTNGYSIYSYEDWTTNKNKVTFSAEEGVDITKYSAFRYEEEFFAKFLDGHLKEIDEINSKENKDGSEDFFVSESGLVFVRVPKGKYFCMGDNRGHSSDSRENGFYDLGKIVGKVEIVVYNYNFAKRIGVVVKHYFAEVEKFFAR